MSNEASVGRGGTDKRVPTLVGVGAGFSRCDRETPLQTVDG